MRISKWKFSLTLLLLSVFLILNNTASNLAAKSSKITESNNLFLSLLPENNNSTQLPQSLSISGSTKKINPFRGKKKGMEKGGLSISAAQLPELKTSKRTNFSSRTKQITKTLSLKDILERSEGRHVFIDEKNIVCRPEKRVAGESLYQDYL